MPPRDDEPPQILPTRSYTLWYDGTGVNKLIDLVSLDTQGIPTGWTASHEHWFQGSTNFGALSSHKTISIRLDIVSTGNPPSQGLLTLMTSLSLPPTKLAKGLLSSKDWKSGTPTASGTAYYYNGTAPDGSAVNVVFDVDQNGNLVHVMWFASSSSVTGYFSGASQGTVMTLSYVSTGIPSFSYYYSC